MRARAVKGCCQRPGRCILCRAVRFVVEDARAHCQGVLSQEPVGSVLVRKSTVEYLRLGVCISLSLCIYIYMYVCVYMLYHKQYNKQ